MRKSNLWGIAWVSLTLLWSCEKIVMPQIHDDDDETEIVEDSSSDKDDGADADDSASDVDGGSDSGNAEDSDSNPDDFSDSEADSTDVSDDADVAVVPEEPDEEEVGNDGSSDDSDGEGDVTEDFHEGVEDDPYTFRDLNESFIYDMVMHEGAAIHDSWIVGYIVGYIDGNKLTENSAVFSYGDVETNILLADSPDVVDYKMCIPVQLSKSGSYGDVRAALNLKYNTDIIGRKVKIRGAVTKYMGVPGLKNAIKYEFVE